MYIVKTKVYPAPEIDKREILRYLKASDSSRELNSLIDACIGELCASCAYRVVYCEVPVSLFGGVVDFGFAKTCSSMLEKRLAGYERAIIFACTVGIGPDRIIAKYSKTAPAMSLISQAVGTERVEALADAFCNDVARIYSDASVRFSPGYSDLSLDFQRDIFRLLSCEKNVGITLSESLIMSPSKSVTAIIGIGEKNEH